MFAIPGYGPTTITHSKYVELNGEDAKKHKKICINITNKENKSKIKGTIFWYFAEKHNQKEVIMSYKLETPFTGMMEDKISLFPTSITSPYRYHLDQFLHEDTLGGQGLLGFAGQEDLGLLIIKFHDDFRMAAAVMEKHSNFRGSLSSVIGSLAHFTFGSRV
ncbi:unnamed protein product [Cyclocybe aegerita]|uniref:Uncharacterized protein n=1 Tax=Cyclocybe aegerita TaxID=1973307 RepID=A0A8S0W3U4_CYCAE|nr:unnamed protein product [Cyclocybe aegerita]